MLRKKQKANVKVFGQRGVEGIKYCGDLPFQWRGAYKLYVWKSNGLPQWVDKRDVPTLIKYVGIDMLSGKNIDAYKAEKKKRKKRRSTDDGHGGDEQIAVSEEQAGTDDVAGQDEPDKK